MQAPKRNRARVLTTDGLKKLREKIRARECEENAGGKYALERLGELTGLDPETVKNVLDCKGSDKRTIARCFESFGITLEDSDHMPASQAKAKTIDPSFVGRDEAISDLNALVSNNAKVIVIQARGGVGKTMLARKYLQQAFGSFLEFPIAKETKDIASIEGLIEEKLRQLGEEPGREFWVSLDRLKRKLQAERIGILIDNLEPALDSTGKFIEAHRRYVELLRVLIDPTVQSITFITSRERLREADVTVHHYPLQSLDVKAWEQFFQSRRIKMDMTAFIALHHAYGGNAKAMDIISGVALEDFSGDVGAYWQANRDDLLLERDLEDLVTKQFNRLQKHDLHAYNLLCRMGCYRYQDVPTVPIEGLFCLLWDVPERRHRRVIKSLQDRSLIDFKYGDFWLHPVIRAESVTRLRKNLEDWKNTNQKAAVFWTDSVLIIDTPHHAKKALEAYFHYLEIGKFEEAGNVLAYEREDKWRTDDPLGCSLYTLGFIELNIFLIENIINKVKEGFSLCRLHNILGDSYWLTGNLNKAISEHKKSGEIATKNLIENQSFRETELFYRFKRYQIVSLFNIGLCKINLWEIKEAILMFEKVLIEASEEPFRRRYIKGTSFCLALLYSLLGSFEEASEFSKQSYCLIDSDNTDIQNEISKWSLGYCFIFLGETYKNIGDIDRSFNLFKRGILFAQESHYPQVKAKALVGLAELYRNQQDFKKSFSHHSEAIELLEKIGAKCDLAEAYYQLGLTFQTVGEADNSNINFQKAIQLFSEMEAPKQVERVIRSMQGLKSI